MKKETVNGKLYLVATPIGNLKDITLRALDILKEVDVIAAEDTRKTGILLKRYDISVRIESFHKFNELKKKQKFIKYLQSGLSVSIVSDAGTPGISDPAYSLVRDAIESRIEIIPVPGANSAISALVVSGLPADSFYFGGFPPRKKSKRVKYFEQLKDRPETLIFFESPHRLLKTLDDIYAVYGSRRCAICRELTKKFESIIRGKLSSILADRDNLVIKGEFVLVIEGNREK